MYQSANQPHVLHRRRRNECSIQKQRKIPVSDSQQLFPVLLPISNNNVLAITLEWLNYCFCFYTIRIIERSTKDEYLTRWWWCHNVYPKSKKQYSYLRIKYYYCWRWLLSIVIMKSIQDGHNIVTIRYVQATVTGSSLVASLPSSIQNRRDHRRRIQNRPEYRNSIKQNLDSFSDHITSILFQKRNNQQSERFSQKKIPVVRKPVSSSLAFLDEIQYDNDELQQRHNRDTSISTIDNIDTVIGSENQENQETTISDHDTVSSKSIQQQKEQQQQPKRKFRFPIRITSIPEYDDDEDNEHYWITQPRNIPIIHSTGGANVGSGNGSSDGTSNSNNNNHNDINAAGIGSGNAARRPLPSQQQYYDDTTSSRYSASARRQYGNSYYYGGGGGGSSGGYNNNYYGYSNRYGTNRHYSNMNNRYSSRYNNNSNNSNSWFRPVYDWWTKNVQPNIKNWPKIQCRVEPTTTLKIRKTFRPLKTIVKLSADFNTQLGVWQFQSSWEDAIIGGKLTLAGKELQFQKSWQISVVGFSGKSTSSGGTGATGTGAGGVGVNSGGNPAGSGTGGSGSSSLSSAIASGLEDDLVTRLRFRAAVDLQTWKAYARVGFRTERLSSIISNAFRREGFAIRQQIPLDGTFGSGGHVKLEVKANFVLPEPEIEYSTESQRSLIGMGDIEVGIEELNLLLDY